MCGELAVAYDHTENVLYLLLTEWIVRGCLFNATFVTISYHVIEISIKSRYSYHRNITMKYIKLDFFHGIT